MSSMSIDKARAAYRAAEALEDYASREVLNLISSRGAFYAGEDLRLAQWNLGAAIQLVELTGAILKRVELIEEVS